MDSLYVGADSNKAKFRETERLQEALHVNYSKKKNPDKIYLKMHM